MANWLLPSATGRLYFEIEAAVSELVRFGGR